MHEAMKQAMGIEYANCESCIHLGSESDGAEPESSQSWPVCRQFERYEFLKPFPFKTEQKCWEPEFWHSKFTDVVDGSDDSINKAIDAFVIARDSVAEEEQP